MYSQYKAHVLPAGTNIGHVRCMHMRGYNYMYAGE